MKRIISLIAAAALFSGCYYDTEQLLYPEGQSCSGVSASFATDVLPLVQSRCATSGCHAAGVTNTGGPLTNYSEIQKQAALVRSSVASGIMPMGSTLSTAEIKSILCWIDSGAPNN